MIKNGIFTHSGVFVSTTAGVPTLDDIALALSRAPRFGGQCREDWSVLDHSMFAAALAVEDKCAPGLVLACLVHDAHEALTGDVPSPFKSAELKVLQADLDRRIMDAYYPGGFNRFSTMEHNLKQYDLRALYAEAAVVGPPSFYAEKPQVDLLGAAAKAEDVKLLQEFKRYEYGPAEFLAAYAKLTSDASATLVTAHTPVPRQGMLR